MNVVIPTMARFYKDSQGKIYDDTGTRDRSFWRRYLEVYDEVTVLARVSKPNNNNQLGSKVETENITVLPIPDFNGPLEFLKNVSVIYRLLYQTYSSDQAYLLRIPDPISIPVTYMLERKNHPFGVEVCGDPANAFEKGAYEHPLRPFIRFLMVKAQKYQCRNAIAASYVTQKSLQEKYPPGPKTFDTYYSSIHLYDKDLIAEPRVYKEEIQSPNIISVGTLSQMYKGPDVFIDSIEYLVHNGVNCNAVWLGGGQYHSSLQQTVKERGLDDQIDFKGQVPSESVRNELDNADVFVLPSRQEGLPRSVIEAMARGLPCIATNINGIPEILPEQDLVQPNDPVTLSEKLMNFISNPQLMTDKSERNLEVAHEYHDSILKERRNNLYSHLKKQTI